jgi:hypothetical protein
MWNSVGLNKKPIGRPLGWRKPGARRFPLALTIDEADGMKLARQATQKGISLAARAREIIERGLRAT